MSLTLTLLDVALRILLTIAVGLALGVDRSVEGHPAGAKTTVLVALAACMAMLQANWLMNSVGKPNDLFVTLDLMRMPLGILTGVGFIGGGAILKRGDNVRGLTMAATLCFVTVIGLCLGGGQIVLGLAGGVLGFLVLRGFRVLEARLREGRPARIAIIWRQEGEFDLDAAMQIFRAAKLHLVGFDLLHDEALGREELRGSVKRKRARDEFSIPAEVMGLTRRPGVRDVGGARLNGLEHSAPRSRFRLYEKDNENGRASKPTEMVGESYRTFGCSRP